MPSLNEANVSRSSSENDSEVTNGEYRRPVVIKSSTHPARRALIEREFGPAVLPRSVSLDDHTEMYSVSKSPLSTLDHVPEPGSTSSLDAGSRANLNMDKISTMTLSEFKSLLHSSSFAVPEDTRGSQSFEAESSHGSNLESLRDKARSVRDSLSSKVSARRTSSQSRSNIPRSPDEESVSLPGTDRPKTPQAARRNLGSAISRPKTPTSLNSHRPQTPTKEEYKMSRPKTPSQIKKDAVSKVAGAISNWVESRNEIDSNGFTSTHSSRPKTPTRYKALLASHSEQLDNDDSNDDDDSSLASSLSKTHLQMLSSSVKERPSTPSRIPKPSFASRPSTPKSVLSDSTLEESSGTLSFHHNRPNNISITRPQLLSRSSSNASSIRSEDGPQSPSGSQGDDKSLRSSRPTTIISRKQQTSTKNGTTRRAITPGPGSSISGLAVTPGPREKWSICTNGEKDAVGPGRRGSLDVCWSNKSNLPQNQQINHDIHSFSNFPITNEITFSDDEEINELVKNAALISMASDKKRLRSSSVDARKLARKKAYSSQEESLVICRDGTGNHGVQVLKKDGIKYDSASKTAIMRRTPSADPIRSRSMTPDSSAYQQKLSASKAKATSHEAVDKSLNRTEAWVDSTLADPKRKQPPHTKRPKGIVNDIPTSELESRPLEEIKALLSESTNGYVQVKTEISEAPPEDPELFRKMEKLFEKYREMELRASVNDTPGCSKVDPNSNKSYENKVPKSASSITSVKTSSGSYVSSSGLSTGNANGINSGKSLEDNRFKRSSSVPLSFQNASMTASHYDKDSSSSTVATDHGLPNSLQDIDAEIANNPTALVSKIKEILKVRPRKDETSEIPTRIPGPSNLNRSSRSKSVTNLYSNKLSSCDEDIAEEENFSPTLNCKIDGTHPQLGRNNSNNSTSGNIAYAEFVHSNSQDDGSELIHTWSGRSDFTDGQSRSETPAPKLATPLTTGRSTLIQKKV